MKIAKITFITLLYLCILPISICAMESTHGEQAQATTEYAPQVYIQHMKNETPYVLELIMGSDVIATVRPHGGEYKGKKIKLPVREVQGTEAWASSYYEGPHIKVINKHTGKTLIEKWSFDRYLEHNKNSTSASIWVNGKFAAGDTIDFSHGKKDSYNIDIIFKGHNLENTEFDILGSVTD